jgi:hypothetical protein
MDGWVATFNLVFVIVNMSFIPLRCLRPVYDGDPTLIETPLELMNALWDDIVGGTGQEGASENQRDGSHPPDSISQAFPHPATGVPKKHDETSNVKAVEPMSPLTHQ